ncbi:MAG: hypothetical protein HY961_03010 [Ignavibacteriae bacterium]|nr:hypothetical protein [Ignavibacteriota bacterium]
MIATEIPHNEWRSYCRDFNVKHSGWPVSVESLEYDGKHRILTNDDKEFAFINIYPDRTRGEVAQIELGAYGKTRQTMIVPRLSAMKAERMANGTDAGLEIYSKDYGIVIIRFQKMFSLQLELLNETMRRKAS